MKLANFRYSFVALILAGVALSVQGESTKNLNNINLDCQNHSQQLIKQLSSAGLLVEGASQRAEGISLQLCSKAQETAQVQHEVAQKKAIENWFFQSTGGKPGNDRLKRK